MGLIDCIRPVLPDSFPARAAFCRDATIAWLRITISIDRNFPETIVGKAAESGRP
jgi:hypothetical protein